MKKFVLFTLVLMFGFGVFAQRQITGRITNAQDGSPMVGATVKVKGQSTGTVTDVDGNYTLIKEGGGDVIIISSMGFKNREITLEPGQTALDVSLGEGNELLGEVVVVGYGTMKKTDITGSVSSLSGDRLKESTITSLDQGLLGRVSGVQVQANSGAPGAASSIRVRGASSITGSNEPLYVIDGIPVSGSGTSVAGFDWSGGSNGQNIVNPLSSIAPQDIVSIDILKDASATAIYGSAGANGVIIVTTRRGDAGRKMQVSYDGYVALQTRAKKLDIMNLRQFADYQLQLYDEGFLPNINSSYLDPSILGEGTDWQDAVTRNAVMHNHNISMSGGLDKTNYAISLGYTNQDGVIINSDFERYTARVSVDHSFGKYFKAGATVSYSRTDENIINNDGINGVVFQSLMMRPDVPVYGFDGEYANPETTEQGSSVFNPVAMAKEQINNIIRQKVFGNVYGQVNILKNLNFRTEIGLDNNNNTNVGFKPNYNYGQFRNAMIMNQEDHSLYWMWKNTVNYYGTFSDVHNLNVLVGSETSRSAWNGIQVVKDQLSSNDIHVMTKDGQFVGNNGWKDAVAKQSFFGRVNYNFDDRYLLTATFRADGSSRFGANNRWGYFPSVAAAWRISNESFMKGSEQHINNLKLRLGYGMNGNDNIGNYLYGSTMMAIPTFFGTAYRMANNANPDLKWETSIQYNVGLDVGLFNSRVDLAVDLYYKTTKDLLLRPSVSPVIGGSSYLDIATAMMNVGKVDNKGIDITLNTHNITTKNFQWSTNLIFSLNRNKVISLDNYGTPIYPADIQQMIFLGGYNQACVIMPGQPIGVFYGYVTEGLYMSAEDLKNSAQPGGQLYNNYDRSSGIWVGDVKYKDISGPNGTPDGIIDEHDQTIIGDPNPDFTFGFNNTFIYKGWELNIGLTGAVGGDIFNVARMKMERSQILWDPQSPTVLGRAQLGYTDGDNANSTNVDNCYIVNADENPTLPRFMSGENHNNWMSDRWIEDGSYLRIQNITLAYSFPKQMIKKAGMQNCKLYVSAQNVWTFTKYSGYDPEIGSFNQNAGFSNVDLGRYPAPRVFTLGANITF